MARPTKPKDLKPKSASEGEGDAKESASKGGGGGAGMSLDLKFIFTILAIFLCTTLSSVAAVYFVAPMVLVPAITAELPKGGHGEGDGEAHGDEEGDEGGGHKPSASGMNLELDEFTVNLKTDPAEGGDNQFLRAKMALTISVPEAENCHHPPAGAEGGGGGHAQAGTLAHQRVPGVMAGAAAPTTLSGDRTLVASGGGGEAAGPAACLDAFKNKMAQFIPAMRDIINTALMKRTAAQLSTTEGVETLKDEIKEQINQILPTEYRVVRVNFQDFIIQR
jgi:flagellar basal body-associated protein FliL